MAIITQTHNYQASKEQVFEHLTVPGRLESWWTTRAQSDNQDGGRFRLEFRHTDAAKAEGKGDMVQEGNYIQCDADCIEFPWQTPAGPTTVRFDIEEEDGNTTLQLSHSDVPDVPDLVENLTGGWQFFLGNLGSVMSGGADGRAQMGIVTN